MRSLRESPEPFSSTSSGDRDVVRRKEVADGLAAAMVVAGRPGYFSAPMVRKTVRAMALLEYLLTSRMTSASVSDSCV